MAAASLARSDDSHVTGTKSFLVHPQRVWWRAVLFQMHLWIGLLLGIYVCVVGLSGSLIVLEEELTRVSRPDLFGQIRPDEPQRFDSLERILKQVKSEFTGYEFSEIFFPIQSEPALQFEGSRHVAGRDREFVNVYVDPEAGRFLGSTDRRFWLARIRDLHVQLMAGRGGFILNGCGAVLLLILAGTGSVIWWPGVHHWKRAFRVDFRRKLSRINFDLHRAVGASLLFFVLVWGVSGIYFVWPDRFVSFLDRLTPARSGVVPTVVATAGPGVPLPLVNFLEKATSMNPGSRVLELELPQRPGGPLVVVLARDETFRRATHVFFDPVTGEVVRNWTRGQGDTFGARFLPWLADLHFGERWGFGVKLLWSALGLAFPILAITGVLMYWNRVLAKKWRRLIRPAPSS